MIFFLHIRTIQAKILRIKKLFIPGLPRKVPSYIKLTYHYHSIDFKNKRAVQKRIILTHGLISLELLTETGLNSDDKKTESKNEITYPLSALEIEYIYYKLHKWRFDLIPHPNVHFSHNTYSSNYSDTLILELGNHNDLAPALEYYRTHTRDMGLQGKEYQKFNLIIQLLERIVRKKSLKK